MNFRKHSGRPRAWIVTAIVACALASPGWSDTVAGDISLDDAIAVVRQQIDGKVLRATTRSTDGRTVHEIRVLTDEGLVKTLTVDAQSGRVQ